MLIGKRIKDLRIANGISQQELGDKVGVTKVSICGYENGSRMPSLETFVMLADTFNTTTDYLLGREVSVTSEESNQYVGAISDQDIEFIQELKHYPMVYNKIIKDIKRSVNVINKKMR